MLPVPAETFTLIGTFALGGVMSLWSKALEAKREHNADMLAAATQHTKAVDAARNFGKLNKGFSFTRRSIALMTVFAVILLPKLVAIFRPDIPVTVGWTQWNPGFWFFGGKSEVIWQTAQGLVMTPLDTHLVTAIAGLYFGASVAKVR